MFGLTSSTLLTLIVIPTIYHLVEGAKERRFGRVEEFAAEQDGTILAK